MPHASCSHAWANMSTSLPFPSSPHCAPRTTPQCEAKAMAASSKTQNAESEPKISVNLLGPIQPPPIDSTHSRTVTTGRPRKSHPASLGEVPPQGFGLQRCHAPIRHEQASRAMVKIKHGTNAMQGLQSTETTHSINGGLPCLPCQVHVHTFIASKPGSRAKRTNV